MIETAAASGIEWATRTYSNANAPVVTATPGLATTSGGSGTPSASFARTSSIVNGRPMMRPIGAPVRIRWASAAMWSSWPCVSTTAAIGCVPSGRTSGSSCSTTPSRSLVEGNPTPQSTTIRSAPQSSTVMFRPTSPRPPTGMIRSSAATDARYTPTSVCTAAPGPVRYLAGSGCGAAW